MLSGFSEPTFPRNYLLTGQNSVFNIDECHVDLGNDLSEKLRRHSGPLNVDSRKSFSSRICAAPSSLIGAIRTFYLKPCSLAECTAARLSSARLVFSSTPYLSSLHFRCWDRQIDKPNHLALSELISHRTRSADLSAALQPDRTANASIFCTC